MEDNQGLTLNNIVVTEEDNINEKEFFAIIGALTYYAEQTDGDNDEINKLIEKMVVVALKNIEYERLMYIVMEQINIQNQEK
ncbi:hypothetical protein RVS70_05770 [Virgibacillus sp. M23]|uniref:hypothetical protein n=1 Tax=Virgibacillus sp. M23 TaxID=3079030 RepID=UPI002A90E24F|nr:hypothetical protein [Virgibacillus sp. M23]MDY7043709.1 hypothetical protein [Virgibacillus sp. M23]